MENCVLRAASNTSISDPRPRTRRHLRHRLQEPYEAGVRCVAPDRIGGFASWVRGPSWVACILLRPTTARLAQTRPMNAPNRHVAKGMNRSRLFMVQALEIVDACRLGVKPAVGAVEHVGGATGEVAYPSRELPHFPRSMRT